MEATSVKTPDTVVEMGGVQWDEVTQDAGASSQDKIAAASFASTHAKDQEWSSIFEHTDLNGKVSSADAVISDIFENSDGSHQVVVYLTFKSSLGATAAVGLANYRIESEEGSLKTSYLSVAYFASGEGAGGSLVADFGADSKIRTMRLNEKVGRTGYEATKTGKINLGDDGLVSNFSTTITSKTALAGGGVSIFTETKLKNSGGLSTESTTTVQDAQGRTTQSVSVTSKRNAADVLTQDSTSDTQIEYHAGTKSKSKTTVTASGLEKDGSRFSNTTVTTFDTAGQKTSNQITNQTVIRTNDGGQKVSTLDNSATYTASGSAIVTDASIVKSKETRDSGGAVTQSIRTAETVEAGKVSSVVSDIKIGGVEYKLTKTEGSDAPAVLMMKGEGGAMVAVEGLDATALTSPTALVAALTVSEYDAEGYNKEGYNKDGLNRSGYDKLGNRTLFHPNGKIRSYFKADTGLTTDYNTDGLKLTETESNGTIHTFDVAGRKTRIDYRPGSNYRIFHADGKTTFYDAAKKETLDYRADGTKEKMTEDSGKFHTYDNTGLVRVRTEWTTAAGTNWIAYYSNGNPQASYDAEKKETTDYRSSGAILKVTEVSGTFHTYNSSGMKTRTDFRPGSNYQIFQSDGRSTFQDAQSGTTTDYRADGTIEKVTESSGTFHSYDESGNRVRIDYRPGANYKVFYYDGRSMFHDVVSGSSFEYRANGSLEKMTEYSGTFHSYDESERKVRTDYRPGEDYRIYNSDGTSIFHDTAARVTTHYRADGETVSRIIDEAAGTTTDFSDVTNKKIQVSDNSGWIKFDAADGETKTESFLAATGETTKYNAGIRSQVHKNGGVVDFYDETGEARMRTESPSGWIEYEADGSTPKVAYDSASGDTTSYSGGLISQISRRNGDVEHYEGGKLDRINRINGDIEYYGPDGKMVRMVSPTGSSKSFYSSGLIFEEFDGTSKTLILYEDALIPGSTTKQVEIVRAANYGLLPAVDRQGVEYAGYDASGRPVVTRLANGDMVVKFYTNTAGSVSDTFMTKEQVYRGQALLRTMTYATGTRKDGTQYQYVRRIFQNGQEIDCNTSKCAEWIQEIDGGWGGFGNEQSATGIAFIESNVGTVMHSNHSTQHSNIVMGSVEGYIDESLALRSGMTEVVADEMYMNLVYATNDKELAEKLLQLSGELIINISAELIETGDPVKDNRAVWTIQKAVNTLLYNSDGSLKPNAPIIVAAAGNKGSQRSLLSRVAGIITVGAVDYGLRLSDYSSSVYSVDDVEDNVRVENYDGSVEFVDFKELVRNHDHFVSFGTNMVNYDSVKDKRINPDGTSDARVSIFSGTSIAVTTATTLFAKMMGYDILLNGMRTLSNMQLVEIVKENVMRLSKSVRDTLTGWGLIQAGKTFDDLMRRLTQGDVAMDRKGGEIERGNDVPTGDTSMVGDMVGVGMGIANLPPDKPDDEEPGGGEGGEGGGKGQGGEGGGEEPGQGGHNCVEGDDDCNGIPDADEAAQKAAEEEAAKKAAEEEAVRQAEEAARQAAEEEAAKQAAEEAAKQAAEEAARQAAEEEAAKQAAEEAAKQAAREAFDRLVEAARGVWNDARQAWDDAKINVNNLESELATTRADEINAATTESALASQLPGLEAAYADAVKALEDKTKQVGSSTDDLQKAAAEAMAASAAVQAIQDKVANASATALSVNGEIASAQAAVAAKQESLTNLQNMRQADESSVTDDQLSAAQSELDMANWQLNNAIAAKSSLDANTSGLDAELAAATAAANEASQRQSDAMNAANGAQGEIAALQEAQRSAEMALQQARGELDQAKATLANAGQKASGIASQLAAAESESQAAQSRYDQAAADLSTLESQAPIV